MRRKLLVLLCLICFGCQQAARKPSTPVAGPQIRATVVTIRTTIRPDNKTWTHSLVIARDHARRTDELDQWRLFDTRTRSVTFVDDVAKTIRTEPVDALLKKRRTTLGETLPGHYPRASIRKSGESRTILGLTAEQMLIDVGGYRREVWVAESRAIPDGLFAMIQASDGVSSPLAPMMRAVDDMFTRTQGFPLLDRAEMPYGNSKLVIEHAVVGIAEKNVPEAMLTLPRNYRDVTPVTKPAERNLMK
jgi:hypothetical protein